MSTTTGMFPSGNGVAARAFFNARISSPLKVLVLEANHLTLLTLTLIVIAWGVPAVVARHGAARPGAARRVRGRRRPAVSHLRPLTIWILAGALIAVGCAALFLPWGPLFDSFGLRLAFTALAVLVSAGTVALVLAAIRVWRDSGASRFARLQGVTASLAGLVIVYAALA